MLSLCAKCDYPPVHAVFKISQKAKLGDVKKEAVASLAALSGTELSRLQFYAVNYKSDVICLDKKSDDSTVGEVGIRDNGYIFIRSPPDMKPAIKGSSKKKKGETDVKDKYHGLSPQTVLSKLKTAKGAKRTLMLEYVDIYLKKILTVGKFNTLPEPILLQIVKRDTLNIKEIELFEAIVAWGKEQLKANSETQDANNLKKVLVEILPHVRFPVMSTEEVAVTVAPTGVLSSEQTLLLFTYLGQSDGGQPKLPAQLKFLTKKRKGRLPPAWFKFDETMKHTSLVLAEEGTMITSSASTYQPCFGNIELKEGIHEWEIVLQHYYSHSYSVCVGVTPVTFTEYTKAQMIGYPGHIPGWSFAAGYGQKFHNSQEAYGKTCVEGDVIRVRLDFEKKSIEFFINGISQGVAYTDVNVPVRPSISLYGANTVALRFPQEK